MVKKETSAAVSFQPVGAIKRPPEIDTSSYVPPKKSVPVEAEVPALRTSGLQSSREVVLNSLDTNTSRTMASPSDQSVLKKNDDHSRTNSGKFASQGTSRRAIAARVTKSEEFWTAKVTEQRDWIARLRRTPTPRADIVEYMKESWKLLTNTFATFVVRTPKLQKVVEIYVANCIKMYQLFTLRGYQSISSSVNEFVAKVLSRFCSSPDHMHELSVTWRRSREALRMVCTHLTNIDLVLSLQAVLVGIQTKFLEQYSKPEVKFVMSMEFVAYALKELHDLSSLLVQRIQELQRDKSFSLSL